MLAGALVQVPATWTLAGVGVVAFGLLPRAAAAISWAAFLFVNLFGEVLGPILGIDYWIAKDAVPYPSLPMVISGEPFTATAIAIMTGVTAVLIAAGLAAVRRRALT
ncbi:PROBABLE TETRONASIN-TRANSPORT INTEGRAL MEMBRANE PROTEIN ABC TRANSPORTER [[Actinomadura] parvosata subsp. kistnae]|nr:PROBABLE TETRONASIN-TRANSPORT INTEGRAL MEMBRANE PROTEIN ABC TRANSPORTER [Actinomadura parvosata subsp. kistnae]